MEIVISIIIMNDNIIEVKNIYKSFNTGKVKVDVLKNISIDIKRGDFLSIMGPSGSGKSTFLYLLGGLDTPTKGTITIDNINFNSLNDKEQSRIRRQKIGFIFQFYNLIPNYTVEDNVLLPIILDNKKSSQYKERLDELLNIVGLYDKKKYVPSELSGGQQQRVAIARALINNPEIIFADEPIGNLDSVTGEGIMELLSKINKEFNNTIIQVTHSKESANYGKSLINLKDGEIMNCSGV
ncbi:MAG: ABC transporter ATP-binding protein [Clostridium sp.]